MRQILIIFLLSFPIQVFSNPNSPVFVITGPANVLRARLPGDENIWKMLRKSFPDFFAGERQERERDVEYFKGVDCPDLAINFDSTIASSGFYVGEIQVYPIEKGPKYRGSGEIVDRIPIFFVYKSVEGNDSFSKEIGGCVHNRWMTKNPRGSGYD